MQLSANACSVASRFMSPSPFLHLFQVWPIESGSDARQICPLFSNGNKEAMWTVASCLCSSLECSGGLQEDTASSAQPCTDCAAGSPVMPRSPLKLREIDSQVAGPTQQLLAVLHGLQSELESAGLRQQAVQVSLGLEVIACHQIPVKCCANARADHHSCSFWNPGFRRNTSPSWTSLASDEGNRESGNCNQTCRSVAPL